MVKVQCIHCEQWFDSMEKCPCQRWDRLVTGKLVSAGLSWEHARIAVGEIAEQRQAADRDGYTRGYNNGYKDGWEVGCKNCGYG